MEDRLYPEEKEKRYPLLRAQLQSMSQGERPITVLSNAAALLYQGLPRINWAGFYLVMEDELILGPFQGKPACTRIGWGRMSTLFQATSPATAPAGRNWWCPSAPKGWWPECWTSTARSPAGSMRRTSRGSRLLCRPLNNAAT